MDDSDKQITHPLVERNCDLRSDVISSEDDNLRLKNNKTMSSKTSKENEIDGKRDNQNLERGSEEAEAGVKYAGLKDDDIVSKMVKTKTDEKERMNDGGKGNIKGEDEHEKVVGEGSKAGLLRKTQIYEKGEIKRGDEEESKTEKEEENVMARQEIGADKFESKHEEEEDEKLMAGEEGDVPSDGRETRNTFILSFSFLCVFSSYFAIQSLQGSLNDEKGLGVISLSCVYAANILSSILAPMCVAIISVKKIILIAFTVHLVYTASNFYPSFGTLIPSSLLLGTITGPLWTCQGIYIATNAMSYAKQNKITKFAALSRFNGIFWSLFELSNIIGNLLASSVLYQGKYNHTVPNASEYCGINDCPGAETMDIIADPEPTIVYILLGVFLCCVSGGIVCILLFLPAKVSQKSEERPTVKKLLFLWFTTIANTDMKFLIPLTLYLAIAETFCFAEITKSYVSCPIGIQNVGYAMAAYGVNTAVFSFVFSRLAKFTKRYILISIAASIHLSLQVWIYHWVPTEEDTVLVYVLIAVWGIADAIWLTQYPALLGAHFPDHHTSVFAIGEGVKAVAFTSAFVYSSLLCMRVKVLTLITFLIVGTSLYFFVEIRFQHKQKGTTQQEVEIDIDEKPSAI